MREIGISPRFSRDKFVPLQTKQRYSTRDISGEVSLTLFFRGFVPFLSLADFVSRNKNLQVADLQRLKSCFGELVTATTSNHQMDCNNDYIYSDADAMYSVGKRFLDGDCLEKDLVKARDLLSRAAALGHQRAKELLMTLDKSDEGDTPDSKVWEDMVSGRVYDAAHPFLLERLNATKDSIWEYNRLKPTLLKERNELLRGLLGRSDEDTFINQPFFCDYGCNIFVGRRFFANFNFTVLDEAPVTIGDDCFIGPNVSIYTACHSTDPVERNSRREWAEPVTIGDNVWIGGSVTILPGVTIGSNVTIGAGSVVVKDIPDGCVAVGNPCKVVKFLNKE